MIYLAMVWQYRFSILLVMFLGLFAWHEITIKKHDLAMLDQEYKLLKDKKEQVQKYADAVQQQQTKINKVSADYEKLKAEQATKVEYVTRTINKYIDRPVYRNVCIDDDGRLQLNELIKSGQSHKAIPSNLLQPCPDLQLLDANTGKAWTFWSVDTVKKYNDCKYRHDALIKTIT